MTQVQTPVWVRAYGSDARFKGQSLLTKLGYVGIGWPEGGDFTGLDTQEKLRAVLDERGKRVRAALCNKDAGIIHKFINVAQIGDVVITRNHADGRIYVGTIVGPYIYDTTQDKHFHSLRQVEWSYDMLPGIFSIEARNLISTSGTFWQMQGDPGEYLKFYRPPSNLQG